LRVAAASRRTRFPAVRTGRLPVGARLGISRGVERELFWMGSRRAQNSSAPAAPSRPAFEGSVTMS
jgi:hypothetical protein